MSRKSLIRVRPAALMLATLLLAVVAGIGAGAKSTAQKAAQSTPPPQNIYFTAQNAGNFNTFIEAVKAAGLVDTLKGGGPFTVFAPTDEAFAKLPADTLRELLRPDNKEKLKDLLTAHIFPVKATSAELTKLNDAKTLKRSSQRIDTSDGLKVGKAKITQADINTSNGVMHAIDTVLLPEGN